LWSAPAWRSAFAVGPRFSDGAPTKWQRIRDLSPILTEV
jgi:hypothetical protein